MKKRRETCPEGRQSARVVPLRRRARPCPICGSSSTPEHRPFCSPRCADIDLGKWLKGDYRIPTEEALADREAESE